MVSLFLFQFLSLCLFFLWGCVNFEMNIECDLEYIGLVSCRFLVIPRREQFLIGMEKVALMVECKHRMKVWLPSSELGMAQQHLGSIPETQTTFLQKCLGVQAHLEEWEWGLAAVAEAEAWAWGVGRGCQGPLVECLAMTCLEKADQ